MLARPWRHKESIHKEEARTVLVAARHLRKQTKSHRRRVQLSNDNLGMVFVLEKGRAACPDINTVCRRFCALSVCWLHVLRCEMDTKLIQPTRRCITGCGRHHVC